jgi:hypothetical protein
VNSWLFILFLFNKLESSRISRSSSTFTCYWRRTKTFKWTFIN